MAGASITSFLLEPGNKLSDSSIAFDTLPGGGVGYYQHGSVNYPLDLASHQVNGVTFGHDGHLYYADSVEGVGSITKSYYDGSGLTTVWQSSDLWPFNVAVAPNGAKIVFDRSSGGIYSINSNGTGLTTLDPLGLNPSISPSGTTVVYTKYTNNRDQLWTVPIGGGTPTQFSTDAYNHFYPTYTPDGSMVLCDVDNGSTRVINAYNTSGLYAGMVQRQLTAGPYTSHPSVSPDGNYLTYDSSPNYSNLTSFQIVIQDMSGESLQSVGSGANPSWSPFLINRGFIGTNGIMSTSACGFLYSQVQSGFDSLLTFSATTPSSASATLQAGTGGSNDGPFVYDLHADDITSLKYVNSYYDVPTSLAPGTSDTLVTIDNQAGTIQSVAPFLATRGSSLKPVKTATGVSYKAHFLAVYDAHGKNLAPKGASALIMDAKHGSIVSVTAN